MVTNIITLKIISENLHKFKNVQGGTISAIRIKERSNDSDVVSTISYNSLEDLDSKISTFPGQPNWGNIQCSILYLYFLSSFNITTENKSNKNIIKYNTTKYETTSLNIKQAALDVLNSKKESYISRYNSIFLVWEKLKRSEYIKSQREYIDCGYIVVYFKEVIAQLRGLYKDNTK